MGTDVNNLMLSSIHVFITALTSSGTTLEWYFLVGPLPAVLLLILLAWYICKRRMAGTRFRLFFTHFVLIVRSKGLPKL